MDEKHQVKGNEIAILARSIGAMVAGAAMMLDDYNDIGKVICEECHWIPDAPHPHHWLLGTLVFLGGIAGACFSAAELIYLIKKN